MDSAPSACLAAPTHPASTGPPAVPPWGTSNHQEKAKTNSGAAVSQMAKAGERLEAFLDGFSICISSTPLLSTHF